MTVRSRKARETSRCAVGWIRPELGGLPLLTIAWLVWCPFGYQKTVDILPLLPAVAFWPAWWAGRALDAIPIPLLRHGALAVLALAIGAYGYADAFLYTPLDTLAHQMRVLRDILPEDDDPGAVIAFGTESVYALGERRALHPFVRLDERMMPFLPLAYSGGCDELIERTLRAEPAVVLIRNDRRQSRCVFALERRLRGAIYERSKVRFEFRRGARIDPEPRDRRRLIWILFRRVAPPTP